MKNFMAQVILLFGAPLIWIAQMNISEIFASHNCYPQSAPLHVPLWKGLSPTLFIISLLALIAGTICTFYALRDWQRARDTRRCFIALMGLMSSAIFLAGILFTSLNIFLVSPC